jgi:LPXTG-site transpeptidase (sortase) family protein
LGTSLIITNQVVWNRSPVEESNPVTTASPVVSYGGGFLIPVTGFAPNVVTKLNTVSGPAYESTDLTMKIPAIKVNTSIVGVEQKDKDWDVSWLQNQAGWLSGTAYPTWKGNSVLTAHVVNADGKPGVFFKLKYLKAGEYIFVYNGGYRYAYKVVSNKFVQPDDSTVLKHEDKSYLTLITCDTYDEETGTYLRRVVVRAMLVDVREVK